MNLSRTLSILLISFWFAASLIGGALGIFNEPGKPPVMLAGFIVVPIAGFIVAYFISSSFCSFSQSIDLKLLVVLHLWRFVGLGFIIGWLVGVLPAGFSLPEGLGDIIAVAGALVLFTVFRKGKAPKG